MIYTIPDLHVYPLEKFKMLLEKAEFSDDDFLYISGDVLIKKALVVANPYYSD